VVPTRGDGAPTPRKQAQLRNDGTASSNQPDEYRLRFRRFAGRRNRFGHHQTAKKTEHLPPDASRKFWSSEFESLLTAVTTLSYLV
jgi:hypothetical protein